MYIKIYDYIIYMPVILFFSGLWQFVRCSVILAETHIYCIKGPFWTYTYRLVPLRFTYIYIYYI